MNRVLSGTGANAAFLRFVSFAWWSFWSFLVWTGSWGSCDFRLKESCRTDQLQSDYGLWYRAHATSRDQSTEMHTPRWGRNVRQSCQGANKLTCICWWLLYPVSSLWNDALSRQKVRGGCWRMLQWLGIRALASTFPSLTASFQTNWQRIEDCKAYQAFLVLFCQLLQDPFLRPSSQACFEAHLQWGLLVLSTFRGHTRQSLEGRS